MFRVPDDYPHVSRRLSEVMGDIGVNERTVNVRRRTALLWESILTLSNIVVGGQFSCYHFGSQSEGTTTIGLNSDIDLLNCCNNANVIKSLDEWRQGKMNFLMIQDDTTPPGYCRLQALRGDIPVAREDIPDPDCEYDEQRRVLMSNNYRMRQIPEHLVRNGPANTDPGTNSDHVLAFRYANWPGQAVPRMVRQLEKHDSFASFVQQHGCFVVPTGHCCSSTENLEWRISTSMAERFMMFNMNITQLRCYVLLKLIIKTFITPKFPNTISSYHCKTVLMHCIESTHFNIWTTDKLLMCVTICLHMLHQCIITNRCPHFFIPGNNLLEGRIDGRTRKELTVALKQILCRHGDLLLELSFDNIGDRLLAKLSPLVDSGINILPRELIQYSIYSSLYRSLIKLILIYGQIIVTSCIKDKQIITILFNMFKLYINGSSTERDAVKLIMPSLCTTVASFRASNCIQFERQLSNQVLSYFDIGICANVFSGRLKLASAFFALGDMERTEAILNNVKEIYNVGVVVPACGCMGIKIQNPGQRLPMHIIHDDSLSNLRSCFAFEVMFKRGEFNCAPQGMRYEMFRCTKEEIVSRDEITDKWMDCAVVDSLPYLYQLQYLTYRRLGRQRPQQIALDGLLASIYEEPELYHRETAMNLLGQCMEQEGRLQDALLCYECSLDERPTHNVARWHGVIVLMKMYNNA